MRRRSSLLPSYPDRSAGRNWPAASPAQFPCALLNRVAVADHPAGEVSRAAWLLGQEVADQSTRARLSDGHQPAPRGQRLGDARVSEAPPVFLQCVLHGGDGTLGAGCLGRWQFAQYLRELFLVEDPHRPVCAHPGVDPQVVLAQRAVLQAGGPADVGV